IEIKINTQYTSRMMAASATRFVHLIIVVIFIIVSVRHFFGYIKTVTEVVLEALVLLDLIPVGRYLRFGHLRMLMLLEKGFEAGFHWPVVVFNPARVRQNEISHGRKTVLFQHFHFPCGSVDLWVLAIPVGLNFFGPGVRKPGDFADRKIAAGFYEVSPLLYARLKAHDVNGTL